MPTKFPLLLARFARALLRHLRYSQYLYQLRHLPYFRHLRYLFAVLALLATPAMSFEKCDNCVVGQAGLGGAYYNFSGQDISSYGLYLSSEARFYAFSRVQAVFGLRLGAGETDASYVSYVANSSILGIFHHYYKLGVNLSNDSIPLYLNVFAEHDEHDGRAWGGRGLGRSVVLLGIEAEGAIPLNPSLTLDYSASYAYASRGRYTVNDRYSELDDGGYSLSASVGFTHDRDETSSFYARLIGIYQDLNASHYSDGTQGYPASRNFIALLEFGIKSL